MILDKNILRFLQFRQKIINVKELEEQYQINLPPIYKSFITVFKPHFAHIKYKHRQQQGFGSFIVPLYSSIEKENYSIDDDEFAFESFKEIDEVFSFPRSNKGYLKGYLFIAHHGYSGGLLVGIEEHNKDKIYHNTDSTVIEYIAENIFELIQRIQLVKYHFREYPEVNEADLYKLWGEDFWRVKNDESNNIKINKT